MSERSKMLRQEIHRALNSAAEYVHHAEQDLEMAKYEFATIRHLLARLEQAEHETDLNKAAASMFVVLGVNEHDLGIN